MYVREEGYLLLLEEGESIDSLYIKVQSRYTSTTKLAKELLQEKNIELPDSLSRYRVYEFQNNSYGLENALQVGIPKFIIGELKDPTKPWELNLVKCTDITVKKSRGQPINGAL